MDVTIEHVYDEVRGLTRTIKGYNSTPGVLTRLTVIELFIEELKNDRDKREGQRFEWLKSLVAPVITGVSVALILSQMIK